MADRSVLVRLRGDVSDFNRAMIAGAASAKVFTSTLDTSTNRMGNLVQTSLALGPALVPIGASAIPVLSGLSNQLAFAAAAAGVTAVAFQGVGDALGAVNDFHLEPTAQNFEKLEQSMATLGPEGQHFVRFLQELRPEMQEIQNIAQAGLFPGVERGISEFMQNAPQIERIVSTLATTLGDLIAEAGDNLNDPRWREFFTFLETEARPTLLEMGRTLGNFAEGFANLWMAFQPLSSQFSSSFLEMSRDFAAWTDRLSETEGFQNFLDYVSRVGPKAWDALGAIGNAFIQLTQAAAPVGEIALPVIEALFDGISALANSPIAPWAIGAVAGISALSRAIALIRLANLSKLAQGLTLIGGKGAGLRAAGAAAGIFALSLTDLDDKMGLANTATFALAGAVAGPWGAAIGAGVGLAMDYAAANVSIFDALKSASTAMGEAGTSVAELNALYDAAAQQVAEFKASVDNVSLSNFDSLKNSFEDAFGRSDVEEAEAALKQLGVTRDEAIRKAQDAAFAEAGLTSEMQNASDATREQTAEVLRNIQAHNDLTNQLAGAFDAETGWRRAIEAANDAMGKNKAGIEGSSKAALDNRDVISKMTAEWKRFADSGGATRSDLDRTRKKMVDFAVSIGVPIDEAKRLARELLALPSPKPKITLEGVAGALDKIRHVHQRLLSLDGTTARTFVQIKESITRADGGLVRRFDNGGVVRGRGGPRDDKIPAMLSNGEFVVNAAATKKYLPELYRMNAQRFADGGPALSRLATGGFPTTGGNDGATAPVAGITQIIQPQPGQSEQEIGRHASDRILWAMELS